ncbi:MAG: hypothetical protein H6838_16025 [Planctomycetes bacterium]|nr:hypothetical protein [Planctomycetota bacterium]MCB9887000.1 hypothetical protein [Planctomycetota bacterium]
MRTIPLLLGVLALAAHAKADKFWLEDPAVAAKAAEGSSAAVIEGVLVAEKDGVYEIRTVGGTLFLPKANVFRVDRDDLTVAKVEQAEKDAAGALDAANQERRMVAEANTRARSLRAVEASARKADAPAAVQPADAGFDAVLGVSLDQNVNNASVRLQLRNAYAQTRDRSYLKTLRQLRRMR